jgi:queuine tRNA-ribosyltransferase
LHHLIRCEEILGPMLLTTHNLTYYQSLMQGARAAILAGRYAEYCATTRNGWAGGGGAEE